MSDDNLQRQCENALREGLSSGLVVEIRRLLEAGHAPSDVLAGCRLAGATTDTLTRLGVEAEIEAVAAEIQARRN